MGTLRELQTAAGIEYETARRYRDRGLIQPSGLATNGFEIDYDFTELVVAKLIAQLERLGMDHKGIKPILIALRQFAQPTVSVPFTYLSELPAEASDFEGLPNRKNPQQTLEWAMATLRSGGQVWLFVERGVGELPFVHLSGDLADLEIGLVHGCGIVIALQSLQPTA